MYRYNVNMTNFFSIYYLNIRDLIAVCKIGSVDCLPEIRIDLQGNKHYETPKIDNGDEILEVPAGKWISRMLADNNRGTNYMCHTLVSNSTVVFNVTGDIVIWI